MKRPQNHVSKRNNVIDLRFVLPHLFVFVFVLQYIFAYVIFVNITVFRGKFSWITFSISHANDITTIVIISNEAVQNILPAQAGGGGYPPPQVFRR